MSAISLVLLLPLCDFTPVPGHPLEIFSDVFAFSRNWADALTAILLTHHSNEWYLSKW